MSRKVINYTDAELSFVKENCTLVKTDLHDKFCQEFSRTDATAENLNSLRKRNGWATGRTGRFKKGHIPSPLARPKGPNKTSFKKGARPHNWKPVGSTRINVDGYLEIKTEDPRKWEQAHTLLWREHYGAIPIDHFVVFIDGNQNNVIVENLELITRLENLQINRLRCRSQPVQVQETVRTLGKLIAKIISTGK